MKGFLAVAAAVVLGAAGLFTALGVAGDNPHGGFVPGSTVGPGDHVPICHALGNGGYELIAPSAGVVFGHAGSSHQDGRDVIPPFVYQPQGNGSPDTSLAGGQNWAAGQALWANDCEAATTSTTSTSTTSTSTTSTTTSTTTTTTSTSSTSTTTTETTPVTTEETTTVTTEETKTTESAPETATADTTTTAPVVISPTPSTTTTETFTPPVVKTPQAAPAAKPAQKAAAKGKAAPAATAPKAQAGQAHAGPTLAHTP